ncbi:MAG TPA: aminoglycoside phosphotransferase family protein [Acidimicrobiales bacterium]|nr:aminoglycoside phosphotransferase family protein [Acidimicrobiales bacterium]
MGRFRVNDIAERKLAMLGEVGRAWYAALDETIDSFASEWGFSVGEVLGGGSHAFVAAVELAGGDAAVFKLVLPDMRGAGDAAKELRVMAAAQGHGYARLLTYDRGYRAMLMERLGAELDDSGLSVDEQVAVICETLTPWPPPPVGLDIETGAEKADWLSRNIEQMWNEVAQPCSKAAIRQAQDFAAARIAAHDQTTAVLVHGDAHQSNVLMAPDGTYRLIDPDPLIAEPAADLSVPMRDWNRELLATGDVVSSVRARCRLIAELTGVHSQAIWEWGYMERVSTALYCHTLGITDWSEPAYAVIEACVGVTEFA